MLRVMMADDNADMRSGLTAFLGRKPGITMVGSAADGREAEAMIERTSPDILLLDLVMPLMDGFELMERLRANPRTRSMRVIVLSSLMRDSFIQESMHKGAFYYMLKPFDPELLYKRILEFAPEAAASARVQGPEPAEECAQRLLRDLGIPAGGKGYRYLLSALTEGAKMGGLDGRVTKELYPAIARLNETTSDCVERAIRHAIEVAWQRGGRIRTTLFHQDTRPTNGEFLSRILKELKS